MRKFALAGVALLALGLPALANDQGMNNQSSQMNGSNSTQSQSWQMPASELNSTAIMQVQQALNDNGFDVGEVDGIWGPDTVSALKEFQTQNDLQPDGKLDLATVNALGLGQGEPTTTGSGSSEESGPMNNRSQDSQDQAQQNNSPASGTNQGQAQDQPQPNGSDQQQ